MNGPGPLVLVVDDEADVRRFLAAYLRTAGYRVLEAGDRAEAVRHGRGPEPLALLVCDVSLPGDTSGRVAAAVTALQPGLPTLFVSGLPYELAVRGNLVPAGCSYLLKPFLPDALHEKAAELLHGWLAAAG
jgi:CheY-like chemotaxis protein